jgi:hypothetical protein
MPHPFFKLFLIILMSLIMRSIYAQTPAPLHPGQVQGQVTDTVNKYSVQSATVSVYETGNNKLLSYQLTNSYGEFSIRNLPVGTALKIVITSIGYNPFNTNFNIPTTTNEVHFKNVCLNPSETNLETVSVTVPPITMNGDTLEFNSAAFKLDSNAVVEDMLRKLDNVTLWGDGKITVNGKEIKSFLVNGRLFFGRDAKIALQNIPKNDVQKIQLYNKADFNPQNPADSTMEMNVKLKKGVNVGYFGKIGLGIGTNKRFESDASINAFSPRTQLSLVGAINNVNKIPDGPDVLIQNSTFKGIGTDVSYQPDFRTYGVNRPADYGIKFNHDFLKTPKNRLKNDFSADYFFQDLKIDSLSDLETTTSLTGGNHIIDRSITSSSTNNVINKFKTAYEYLKNDESLNIEQSYNQTSREYTGRTTRTARIDENINTSSNNSFEQSHSRNQDFEVSIKYTYPSRTGSKFGGIIASYDLGVENTNHNSTLQSNFISQIDTTLNKRYDRKYALISNNLHQALELELPNLKKLLFGKLNTFGFNFALSNALDYKRIRDNNIVDDFDQTQNGYQQNDYLSNRLSEQRVEETPGFHLVKVIKRNLSNRFSTALSMKLSAMYTTVYQKSTSTNVFQNIDRRYQKFVPQAQISYYDDVFGEHENTYSLDYKTRFSIPDLQMLAPLTDSINRYNLLKGNLNLKSAVERKLAASYIHADHSTVNTLNYNASLTLGMVSDAIVDSILIDNQNRRVIYQANAKGRKYLILTGKVQKAFKFPDAEMQLSLDPKVELSKYPVYINNVYALSNNFNTTIAFTANYRLKNIAMLELGQTLNTYRTRQTSLATLYSGNNLASTISSSVNMSKRLSLASNLTINKSTASGDDNSITFTIWNANATYRMLKGNNLEFKISALDLLKQNNSVVNFSNANSFTLGSRNVLQQYFMTTLSYYPRKFGKKANTK